MRDKVRLISGDCRHAMRLMAARGIAVDSIVTDPPYHLTSIVKRFGANGAAPAKDRDGLYKRASSGFMGQTWDGGDVAFDPATWALALAVLKPGGHLLAFGGTRGWHRMACAIEDAGFEIRDTVAWLYGTGFPKSHDIGKAIDKAAGAEREVIGRNQNFGRSRIADGKTTFGDYAGEWDTSAPATPEAAAWDGWGTALKPAFEPIVLARKPLSEGSVAANVLRHGTGAVNVDGCRVGTSGARNNGRKKDSDIYGDFGPCERVDYGKGRWPANVCTDGSEEVEAAFASFGELKSGRLETHHKRAGQSQIGTFDIRDRTGEACNFGGDSGTAARFFYSAKADAQDRWGSKHPTVKPVALMRWLVRLVTPPGGLVLDPFAGSGTTGIAAMAEGMRCVLIEADPEYRADIRERLAHYAGEGRHSLAAKARHKEAKDELPLFPEAAE